MACVIEALVERGYRIAWRVLDAQYFGVPQRRRRVFVVGCARGWQYPAKVLFEQGCLSGDFTKGRKKREETPAHVGKGFAYGGSNPNISDTVTNKWHKGSGGPSGNECGLFVAQVYENHPSDSRVKEMGEVCQTVTSTWGSGGGNIPFVQSFRKSRRAQSVNDFETWVDDGKSNTLNTFDLGDVRTTHAVAYGFEPGIAKREGNPSRFNENISPTLRADMGDNQVSIATNMAVRRLTPTECERLQGFPDGYTDIKPNGKQTPDGPRYKALGNSMAVPVMRWIGERINKLVALNNLM
jgi:DNA (cytosine-5)-methyltransferase 1